MPRGFSDSFSHYLPPSRDQIASAFKSGLIVLDTNVLLNCYRFAADARDQLLTVLEEVADRIWVPHQVALEFHRNRLQVIGDQATAYDSVLAELRSRQEAVSQELTQGMRQLVNRAALSAEERSRLVGLVDNSLRGAIDAVTELRDKHGVVNMLGSDQILTRLNAILDGKVGPPFSQEEQHQAVEESKRRTDNNLPPGYKDAKKEYQYGDYFIWRQALSRAASSEYKQVIFVTGDIKEDWYKIVKGRSICARPELTEEALATGIELIMLNVDRFLSEAKRYLGVSVSSETIRQVATLPSVDRESTREDAAAAVMSRLAQESVEGSLLTMDAKIHHSRDVAAALQTELTRLVNRGMVGNEARVASVRDELQARQRDLLALSAMRNELVDRLLRQVTEARDASTA